MQTTIIRKIALGQLVLSPTNARKTKPSAADDAALEASIAAHGLKQNLGVEAGALNAENGETFLVHAGGRRLKALQALCEKGVIDAAYRPKPIVLSVRSAMNQASVTHLTGIVAEKMLFVQTKALPLD